MNIQTEQLDNHTARFTVEIDPQRFQNAKQQAAKKLAKRVRIPGFRKGKAPYRILVQNGLEPQIIMDAVDSLSQVIYRETLEQSEIEPYGPGAFEDYEIEPPVFKYTVPLQPTIELGDYRDVRVDYEEKHVEDDDVEAAMKQLQEQEALREESDQPVQLGNTITVAIHSEFADEVPETISDDDENEEETPTPPAKGEVFIHEHGLNLTLDAESEPILPGFKNALVGSNKDEEVIFELTIPEDHDEYADIAGRKISFNVTVEKIEVVTLPELNDEFAAKITENEDDPLTLLQLRMRVRENLENELENQVKNAYSSEVLSKMVEGATIKYPDAMVEDQIDAMIEDLNNRMMQSGMNLETYLQITNKTKDDLREDYRENASESVKRSLVLREVMIEEKVKVSADDIEEQISQMFKQFPEDQHETIRPLLDTPSMRENIANNLLNDKVLDRIILIGKNEAPDLDALEDETDEEEIVEAEETVDVVEAETQEDTDTPSEESAEETEE